MGRPDLHVPARAHVLGGIQELDGLEPVAVGGFGVIGIVPPLLVQKEAEPERHPVNFVLQIGRATRIVKWAEVRRTLVA